MYVNIELPIILGHLKQKWHLNLHLDAINYAGFTSANYLLAFV